MADTINGHVLMTSKTCSCKDVKLVDRTNNCPVCDWGLGVCVNCGAAEIGLDKPCEKIPMIKTGYINIYPFDGLEGYLRCESRVYSDKEEARANSNEDDLVAVGTVTWETNND